MLTSIVSLTGPEHQNISIMLRTVIPMLLGNQTCLLARKEGQLVSENTPIPGVLNATCQWRNNYLRAAERNFI